MNKQKSLVPRLRFPEFTYAWEQKKLGELVEILNNLRIPITASERVKGETPYYGANGIQDYVDGFTHNGEFVLVAEDGANDINDYPVQYVSGKIWVNNHAHVLNGFIKKADNLFLVPRIKSMDISKYLVGGGRAKLNANVMKNIELNIPHYQEQQKIGNFFTALDRYITIHQRKLENAKKLKSGLLQKMFPKNDQEFPEIRFPEFTYAWEQKKLGELVFHIKSYPLSRNVETKENTNFKYIHYGDIHTGIANILDDPNVLPNITGEYSELLQLGDLVVADASEDYKGVAYPCVINCITKKNVVAGLHTIAIRPSKSHHLFLYYLLHSQNFKEYCKKVGTGTKVFAISAKNLLAFETTFPSEPEQQKIGNFFTALDRYITIHQRKVEDLKNLKKSLLQQMFV